MRRDFIKKSKSKKKFPSPSPTLEKNRLPDSGASLAAPIHAYAPRAGFRPSQGLRPSNCRVAPQGSRQAPGLKETDIPALQVFFQIKQSNPESKPRPFPNQHEQGAFRKIQLVKAQAYGKDIAHERQPGEQGYPGPVFVDPGLLLLQGLFRNAEPLFYPFPFAEPAQAVRAKPAEPIPGRGRKKGKNGVASRQKNAYQQDVGRERDYRRGHERPEEQAYVTPFLQKFHCRIPFLMRNSAPTRKPAPVLFYGKVPEPDCPQARIVRTSAGLGGNAQADANLTEIRHPEIPLPRPSSRPQEARPGTRPNGFHSPDRKSWRSPSMKHVSKTAFLYREIPSFSQQSKE